MRRRYGLALVLFTAAMAITWSAFAKEPLDLRLRPAATNPANPYPGGSPFKPGAEPSMTHEVKVYWTTLGGLETRVDIIAPGGRPTQTSITKAIEGKSPANVMSTIASNCQHRYRISAKKKDPTAPKTPREEGVSAITADGHGTVVVKVFGWKKKEFATPPTVLARYFHNGRLVGQTSIEAKPIPAKILKKQPHAPHPKTK